MKLLILSDLWQPFPGGAERFVYNIAKQLSSPTWDGPSPPTIEVFTDYQLAKRLDGPPLWPIESVGVRDNHDAGWETLAKVIGYAKPDVLLVHHFWAFEFEAELVATGIPLVQVIHNGHRIPEAALAVYNTEWTKDQLGDAQPRDMVIIPPAFEDVSAPTHRHAVGFIKPIEHKGVHLVNWLTGQLPDREFVILRGEWQENEVLVDRPNVRYMEPVVDIRDFYSQVDLVLVPSISEDAGTVAQECAVNHIPCLTSKVQGLAETNRGGIFIPMPADDEGYGLQWVTMIEALDNRRLYESVVRSQLAAIPKFDWSGKFGRLAGRIADLGGGW